MPTARPTRTPTASRYGTDPLLHLAAIGVLDRNTTLAHANHLTDAECEVLLECGASLAWAPAASMLWGHGGTLHGRHAELWRRGGNIGLGSDSANWSNDFDLFRQANLAVLTARDAHEERTYLLAEDVLRMATRGGARATGLETEIGSLEVGKRADLVIHTLDRPEMRPVTDMLRNLVYAAVPSRSARSSWTVGSSWRMESSRASMSLPCWTTSILRRSGSWHAWGSRSSASASTAARRPAEQRTGHTAQQRRCP